MSIDYGTNEIKSSPSLAWAADCAVLYLTLGPSYRFLAAFCIYRFNSLRYIAQHTSVTMATDKTGDIVYENKRTKRTFTSPYDALNAFLADTTRASCHPKCLLHRLPASQLHFLLQIGAIDEAKTICARDALIEKRKTIDDKKQAQRIYIESIAEKIVERELRRRDEDGCWSLGWVSLAAFLTCIAIVFVSVHMSVTTCRVDMLTHLREFPHNPLSAFKPIKPGPGLNAGHSSHEAPFAYNGLNPPSEYKKCNA